MINALDKKKGTTYDTFYPRDVEGKSRCINSRLAKMGTGDNYIVHNLQQRSPDRPSLKNNKNAGGSGHLSKSDGKTYCLDTGNTQAVEIKNVTSRIRRLTPTECERLQTVKQGYTNHVSDSQRYKMLGNGWTVDVIAYIFSHINK